MKLDTVLERDREKTIPVHDREEMATRSTPQRRNKRGEGRKERVCMKPGGQQAAVSRDLNVNQKIEQEKRA